MDILRKHPNAFWISIVIMVVLSAMLLRSMFSARLAMEQCESSVDRKRISEIQLSCPKAIRWYFPGTPYAPRAIQILRAQATMLEQQGQADQAVSLLRAARGAILSVRSTYTPFDTELDHIEQHLAGLLATEAPPARFARLSPDRMRAKHLRLLSKRTAPDTLWSIAALLSFFFWLYCVSKLIAAWSLLPADGVHNEVQQRYRWAGTAMAAFISFAIFLWLA